MIKQFLEWYGKQPDSVKFVIGIPVGCALLVFLCGIALLALNLIWGVFL